MEERLVVIRHGETFEDVLRAAGVPHERIDAIVAAFAPKRGEPVVAEGRRLKLLFAEPRWLGSQHDAGPHFSLFRRNARSDRRLT